MFLLGRFKGGSFWALAVLLITSGSNMGCLTDAERRRTFGVQSGMDRQLQLARLPALVPGASSCACYSMFELEINNILTITLNPDPLPCQAIICTVAANGHSGCPLVVPPQGSLWVRR